MAKLSFGGRAPLFIIAYPIGHLGSKVATAKFYQELASVFSYLCQQLDDHHGTLLLQNKKNLRLEARKPAYRNQVVRQAINPYPSVRVLTIETDVGYILLLGKRDFNSRNINADTQAFRDALRYRNTAKIKKWILVLQVNSGGSMYQMLAGLADLLGGGQMGQFVK